jgi:hypothetical protein
MADTKISGLAAVTDVLSTDEFVLARSGTTKKIDAVDLAGGLTVSELDYATRTSSLSITATSAATAQSVVAGAGFTASGTTEVWIEFGFPSLSIAANAAGNSVVFHLWLDGADTTMQFMQLASGGNISPIVAGYNKVKLTPAAGTRTYEIKAYRGTANCTLNLNATTYPPAFLRIVAA